VIRKQLDWVAEAADWIFANAFEIEIAFDEVGELAGEQHRLPQLFGEGFETRSHFDRRTDDREVEPGARPDMAVHDVADVDAERRQPLWTLSGANPMPSIRSPLKSELRWYCSRAQASTNAFAAVDGRLMFEIVIGPPTPRHSFAPSMQCSIRLK
jgi:hypothetical protein